MLLVLMLMLLFLLLFLRKVSEIRACRKRRGKERRGRQREEGRERKLMLWKLVDGVGPARVAFYICYVFLPT